jgi:pimeloyl-ACP methyl ester carboxylesterase
MTADIATIHLPATLGAHELVLLHGQAGSPADWAPLAGRLPAQFHVVAAERLGYGSSRLAAGGFAANARALLADLDSRRVKRAVLVGHSYAEDHRGAGQRVTQGSLGRSAASDGPLGTR